MTARELEFARLDALMARLLPIVNVEVGAAMVDAARSAGSVNQMPEPFRVWLTAPDDLPWEILEINYAQVMEAREKGEVPPMVEGTP